MKLMKGFFSIIKRSFLRLILSVLLCIGAWILFIFNFRASIEFTGGVQMSLHSLQKKDQLKGDIITTLITQGFKDTQVNITQNINQTSLLINLPFNNDADVKKVSDSVTQLLLKKGYITNEEHIIGVSLNGPSVSNYMRSSTINALIIGIVFIAIYMMFSFASMRKHISPLTLAFVVVATMIFDISIPVGAYGLWMMIDNTVTVDTIFIIALMTTMGYSINDTIIVLDRIRENIFKYRDDLEKGKIKYLDLFESSLWQTMRRSMGTSFATFLAVLSMYIFGESVMKSFSFTMGIGVLCGSFSSLFVGAPLAYLLLGKWKKELKGT